MEKLSMLHEIAALYANGENIMKYFRDVGNTNINTKESIMISYDFQAGSYTKEYYSNPANHLKYSNQIGEILKELGAINTILEAGVGEATTFKNVVQLCNIDKNYCYGFDISWSRIKTAREFMAGGNLFVADLFSIPLPDDSIDVVYTSHSIEPNGGFERQALQELYRVAKDYLVLFEPDYELANEDARKRMEGHGYVKSLYSEAKNLGYTIIMRNLLEFSLNPLNPTSVIVIKKKGSDITKNGVAAEVHYQCPITKSPLVDYGEAFFSESAFLLYPVIKGIPCLLDTSAILASKYLD